MANTLYLSGQKFNHLERAAAVTVATGAEDPLYPVANIYDVQSDVPFRFNAIVANGTVKCDLDLLAGLGNFTTWPGPSGWTNASTGGGTVTQLSPGKDGTGSAARLNSTAAGQAIIAKTFVARAGEMLKLDDLLAFQVAGAGVISLFIQNLSTGNYWTGSVWTATPTALTTQAVTAWATKTTSAFQVEAYGGSNPPLPTLKITISAAANVNANCDVDDVYIYPGVNFAAFFGHNFDSVSPSLNHSTDNFAVNNTALVTFTIAKPACYVSVTMTYKRWWAFTLNGTPQVKPYVGEFVLGQAQTAARGHDIGFETTLDFPQFRYETPGGHLHVAGLTADEVRGLHVTFRHVLSELAEIKNEWVRRSLGGLYPMVLVPLDSEAAVYHGRILPSFAHSRQFVDLEADEITIRSSPFPTFVG